MLASAQTVKKSFERDDESSPAILQMLLKIDQLIAVVEAVKYIYPDIKNK